MRIVDMDLDMSDNHSAAQLRSIGFDHRIERRVLYLETS